MDAEQVMRSMEAPLSALPLQSATRDTILGEASSLIALAASSPRALHERLKAAGVAALGMRVKIKNILCDARTIAKSEVFRAALEANNVGEHAEALCREVDSFINLAASSPRELHEALRKHGVKALGQRQKVLLALDSLSATTLYTTTVPAPPLLPPLPPPPENQESDGDDGPMIEDNADANGGDDQEDDGSLQLEDNLDGGSAIGSDDDGDGLELEENAIVAHPTSDATFELELSPPPVLTSVTNMQPGMKATDPVEGALNAGVVGSKALTRKLVVDDLLNYWDLKFQTQTGQGRTKERLQKMMDACNLLHFGFTSKLLNDDRWRRTVTALGTAVGTAPSVLQRGNIGVGLSSLMGTSLSLEAMLDDEPRTMRVAVLGMGSGVPALAAAKAGAEVVWAERVGRLSEICTALAKRNKVEKRVHVLEGSSWESMQWEASSHSGQPAASSHFVAGVPLAKASDSWRFDSVLTEEISDDLLSDGLLSLARLARQRLLKPSGTFYPRKSMVYAALASVRTTSVGGFDARMWNVFRHAADVPVYDLEEVFLNEPGCGKVLSEPIFLFSIDLNDPPQEPPPLLESIEAPVSADGIFNCIVSWFDLDFGEAGGTLSFAPNADDPKHMYYRAIKNRLRFVGFEQRVAPGETVRLDLHRSESNFNVTVSADRTAETRGTLVRWPGAPLLSYHFPMIAEQPRNVRYERALLRAIRAYQRANDGRGPHVLDIGSGTGLLALMAARGGARQVTSVEMVPAIAEVARQIVARNGYADVVTILNTRSDELSLYAMGGEPADLLVSELIDDHVIGDGVLSSIADARRRLLTREALIVPRGGRMFAVPISLRAQGPKGVALDDLNILLADQLVLTHPYHSTKLQRLADSEYDVLAPPVELFDFDWAGEIPGTLAEGRTGKQQTFWFNKSGCFNGVLITFTLQMDAREGMASDDGDDTEENATYSSGFDNPETHWDNPVRFLPVELHVQAGQTLYITPTHNLHDLDHIEIGGVRESMLGLGHRSFLCTATSEPPLRLGVTLRLA